MKTYKIENQKDLDKFKDDYGYKIDGNAEFYFSAVIEKSLIVDGYLYIEAGEFIEAEGSIEAGEFIKAGWSIEAREFIKAGGFYGISAGLSIMCKGKLKFGLKAFAGICTWKKITDEEKTITCGKIEGGVVEYGILKETGLEEEKKETIKIGDLEYDKMEVEKRLRGIKPLES